MVASSSSRSEPILQPETVQVPPLGPERLFQVVYLPSDPARARMRADLTKSDIAVYGTAGMFLFIGLVFGAVGLFLMRKRRGLTL